MTTTGIHHLLVQTHDYDGTLAFWNGLGFALDFETGHGSAKLDPPTPGPYVFVDSVGLDEVPRIEVYVDVIDHTTMPGEWEATHWGTHVQRVEDADGRNVWLQEVGPAGH